MALRALLYVSSCCYTCVLMLLYMWPHVAIHVASCCYTCGLMLLYMWPHAAIHLASCCYTCRLMLLYMSPLGSSTICVSPRTVVYVSSTGIHVDARVLYVCTCLSPYTAICVYMYVAILHTYSSLYVWVSHTAICVLILAYTHIV